MNTTKQFIFEFIYLSLTIHLTSLPRYSRQFRFNIFQYYFSFISAVTNHIQVTKLLTKEGLQGPAQV